MWIEESSFLYRQIWGFPLSQMGSKIEWDRKFIFRITSSDFCVC